MIKQDVPSAVRVVFALGRLDDELRAEVLADGVIIKRFKLASSSPVRVNKDISIPRDELFAAFLKAAEVEEVQLPFKKGSKNEVASIRLDQDGAAILQTVDHNIRFPHAALHNANLDRRLKAMQVVLGGHTLASATKERIVQLVKSPSWDTHSFLGVMELLEHSPEAFRSSLSEKAQSGALRAADLLPSSDDYWFNLLPRADKSLTLTNYVDDELRLDRAEKSRAAAEFVFDTVGLTMAAPALTPHDLAEKLPHAEFLVWVSNLAAHDDHFSLVGAFEIASRQAASSVEAAVLCSEILKKLFGDMEEIEARCYLFAAVFVLATARLATSSSTQKCPVFWRRLVAAAHAGLVVRTCNASPYDYEKLLGLALQQYGREYLLSCALDMRSEQRWDPEWISPDFLIADAFGRVDAAAKRLAEGMPPDWRQHLEAIRSWIDSKKYMLKVNYPAVLEGSLLSNPSLIPDDYRTQMSQDTEQFANALDEILLARTRTWVSVVGPTADLPTRMLESVDRIRSGREKVTETTYRELLSLATAVAVRSRNPTMVAGIATALLERGALLKDKQAIVEVVICLTQLSTVEGDSGKARQELARQLEFLAFSVPIGKSAEELGEQLACIGNLDAALAKDLGAALHASRLAMSSQSTGG